jgi:hypothetical protein
MQYLGRTTVVALAVAGAMALPASASAAECATGQPTSAKITGVTIRVGPNTFSAPGQYQKFGCFGGGPITQAGPRTFGEGEYIFSQLQGAAGGLSPEEPASISMPHVLFPLNVSIGPGEGGEETTGQFSVYLNMYNGVYSEGSIHPTFRFSKVELAGTNGNPDDYHNACFDFNIMGWLQDAHPGPMISARGSQGGRFATTQVFRGPVSVEGMYVYDPFYCWEGPQTGNPEGTVLATQLNAELGGVGGHSLTTTGEMETTLELTEP